MKTKVDSLANRRLAEWKKALPAAAPHVKPIRTRKRLPVMVIMGKYSDHCHS